MKKITHQNLSHIEESLMALRSEIVPTSHFLIETKAKVFDGIDNSLLKKKYSFFSINFWQVFKQSFTFVFSFLFAFTILNVAFLTTAQPSRAEYVGEVTSREGEVYIMRANSDQKIQVFSPEKLYEGDTIEVANHSNAEVYFYNSGQTSLSENTKIRIEKIDHASTSETKIALALQKGQLDAKVDPASSTTSMLPKISIITTSGVVEATTNADFSVSLNDNGTIAKVTSSQEKVSVIASSTNTVVVQEGNSITGGDVIAHEQFEAIAHTSNSGALLATAVSVAPVEIVKKSEKNNEIVPKISLPTTSSVGPKETVVPLPDTVTLDVYQLGVLQEISSATDIAQVKIQNIVKELNSNNSSAALVQLRSYNATLDRIAADIANLKHINTVVPKQPLLAHVVDFTVRSYLNSINSAYTSVVSNIDQENKAIYFAVQKKLHHLARIEALLKSQIELQSK